VPARSLRISFAKKQGRHFSHPENHIMDKINSLNHTTFYGLNEKSNSWGVR
jgi:hypothetical protein